MNNCTVQRPTIMWGALFLCFYFGLMYSILPSSVYNGGSPSSALLVKTLLPTCFSLLDLFVGFCRCAITFVVVGAVFIDVCIEDRSAPWSDSVPSLTRLSTFDMNEYSYSNDVQDDLRRPRIQPMETRACTSRLFSVSASFQMHRTFNLYISSFISYRIYRSFNPFPLRMSCIHFSTLDSRVLDCLGAEKCITNALCRPGVNASKAVFKAGFSSNLA